MKTYFLTIEAVSKIGYYIEARSSSELLWSAREMHKDILKRNGKLRIAVHDGEPGTKEYNKTWIVLHALNQ